MKIVELQEKLLGGLSGNLNHYFANGKRITKEQYIAIKNESINNGEYLNGWDSRVNGVVVFGQYVKVKDDYSW